MSEFHPHPQVIACRQGVRDLLVPPLEHLGTCPPEGLPDRLVPPVQSDHHRLPFEKVTVQIPADHVLTARLEEVYNFGKVFGCCIFTCYTCHRNQTCQEIHNFELTSHLHSPRTMSKEPLPCERGRLSYVIVLFGLTHRALGEENILMEGTKSNFEAI